MVIPCSIFASFKTQLTLSNEADKIKNLLNEFFGTMVIIIRV